MTLKEAVGKVLEGWTLPNDVRKILEEALAQRNFDYKEHAEGLQRDYDLLLAEYKHLKAQRTWVGLTDKDIWNVLCFRGYNTDTIEIAKAIEAKLKGKNT